MERKEWPIKIETVVLVVFPNKLEEKRTILNNTHRIERGMPVSDVLQNFSVIHMQITPILGYSTLVF